MALTDFTEITGASLPPGGGTPGRVAKFNGAGDGIEDSSIIEETDRIRFNKKLKVPAASIIVGEATELSEGTANLVIVDLLKNTMGFAASVDFDDATGSAPPTFPNLGNEFTLNINTDDTQILTANPLTFQLTGTVVAPDIRVIKKLTIRTNGVMTNFRVKVTDNATGLVLRYVPSQAAFEGDATGLSLISGDNTFVLNSNDANTSGVFNLGFIPFVIESGQVIDFEIVADSVNLKGDAGGIPFLVAGAHDGPPVTVATEEALIGTEEFANTNNRFFGELGLPAGQQSWVDTATGTSTIDLATENVFGTSKQVVRHNDDTAGGATTSKINLTAQNWTDINAFGASYSGVARLDSADGTNGFFSGLQADAAENPIDGNNRRYGFIFDNSGGNLRLTEADGADTDIMDGTSGNPSVLFDEWFTWECVVPAGLGQAQFYINGILTTFLPLFGINGGGLGTQVQVGSGSTGGINRVVFHDNFGVTIYEESSTKTLSVATMAAKRANIFVPGGRRDYTVVIPDGNPRKLGDSLHFIVQNIGGKVKVKTENIGAPQTIFNGLREIEKNTVSIGEIHFDNIVEGGNVYIEDAAILNQDALGSTPGSINYDPVKGTMNVRNAFPGSSIQVGQENVIFVVNNSGAPITDGKVVKIAGFDAVNDAFQIEMALADSLDNVEEIIGITTTTMINGQFGLVTTFGRVNDLDTSSFSVNDKLFLSDTVPGALINTRPDIAVEIGHVGVSNATTGFIQVLPREIKSSINLSVSSNVTQSASGSGTPTVITFNTEAEIKGITHSTTVNPEEFTIDSSGTHHFRLEPQPDRGAGGSAETITLWADIDTGGGFAEIANTAIRYTAAGAGSTGVPSLTIGQFFNKGDKFRFRFQVTNTAVTLKATAASSPVPATPSAILTGFRVGG